jgi:hypothetical protein
MGLGGRGKVRGMDLSKFLEIIMWTWSQVKELANTKKI